MVDACIGTIMQDVGHKNYPHPSCEITLTDGQNRVGMYRIRIPVSGKIMLSGKILPDSILVFEIGETGVKTLE